MYHEKKGIGYWKTIYSVVRDLDVLKQVFSFETDFKYFVLIIVF